MRKSTVPTSGKALKWIFWGIVITITLIWLISQQIQLNKFRAENAALEKEMKVMEEEYADLSNEDTTLTDEEIKNIARQELHLIENDDQVVKPK